jgi:hypothetical protein
LNEDLFAKSNIFSQKDGRNSRKSRVKTAITRGTKAYKANQNDIMSNVTRNKSLNSLSFGQNHNEASMLRGVLQMLKKYNVNP